MAEIALEPSWREHLQPEFSKPYMLELKQFLQDQKAKKRVIYPRGNEIFAALNETPFAQVKVVILGQDPYHGPNQAHGLCFSVRQGVELPPSLKNIFVELKSDLGIEPPSHGCLTGWARQGVLLLNATLSVEAGRAGSHQGKGWELFTDRIVDTLNRDHPHLAFVLWGSYAQKKGQFIDRKKHLVVESPHPSPLSVYRGFFGSKPFSKINRFLESKGMTPIDWSLAEGDRH